MLFFDSTYIFVIIGAMLSLLASSFLKNTYARYSKMRSSSGLTGAQMAKKILAANGIYDVNIQPVQGQLTDNYDPKTKTLNLSQSTYNSTAVTALGVAAHECGHAIQDNQAYLFLKFRTALAPVASIGANISWPLIIFGILIGGLGRQYGSGLGGMLVEIGIFAFLMAVIFQIITLPVEFNASSRAIAQLESFGIMDNDEENAVRKVLKAAALTYVAAAASAILQLLRIMVITGGRRRK